MEYMKFIPAELRQLISHFVGLDLHLRDPVKVTQYRLCAHRLGLPVVLWSYRRQFWSSVVNKYSPHLIDCNNVVWEVEQEIDRQLDHREIDRQTFRNMRRCLRDIEKMFLDIAFDYMEKEFGLVGDPHSTDEMVSYEMRQHSFYFDDYTQYRRVRDSIYEQVVNQAALLRQAQVHSRPYKRKFHAIDLSED